MLPLLNEEEQARAGRFLRQSDRVHFIGARALLRTAIGSALGVDAEDVEFSYGLKGKPGLARDAVLSGLQFNLSHSHGCALIAVACGRRIGVDIEKVRDDLDYETIACRHFSAAERQWLASLPPTGRRTGFFWCWTGKEAYVKARGEGLSFPLDSVSILPVDGSTLSLQVDGDTAETQRWMVRKLPMPAGWSATVVVEAMNQVAPPLTQAQLADSVTSGA
jgi:4'-phosphopantetheinyl transferase